ncbi:MAG: hypothetical protein AAGU75_18835, partial [Bacillota bacterium]
MAKNWQNDRWAYNRKFPVHGNRFPGAVHEWIKIFDNTPRLEHLSKKKVLFFTGGFNVIENCIAIAFVLAHRNCDIDLLYFENIRTEGSNNRYSTRKFKYYYGKAINELLGAINVFKIIPLSSISKSTLSVEMIEAAKTQAMLDTVYVGRRESIELNGREKMLFKHRLEANSDAMAGLLTLMKQNNYDVLVTPNGAVREFGAAFRLAEIMNLPAGTFEFWSKPGTCCVSYGPCVMRMNTDELWRKNTATNIPENLCLRGFETIMQRAGNKQQYSLKKELVNLLHLDAHNPIALVCPNVPFDGMFVGSNSIFSSMREWLTSTVKHLMNSSRDINVIIRSHPHELRHDAVETTVSILNEEFGKLPVNIHVIPAGSTISTYEIMKFTDIGLVYSSTTGLEMASFGIPVINANFFHYSRRGFTYDPNSIDEYFTLIDRVILNPSAFRLGKDQLDLALLYADVFFNQLPLAFPWSFLNFWCDMNQNPLDEVLSKNGDERFGRTFDTL